MPDCALSSRPAASRSVPAAAPVAAYCDAGEGPFAIALRALEPDGCIAEAARGWRGDEAFVRIALPGGGMIAGQVEAAAGHEAQIRFFGQLHPAAIERWRSGRAPD